MLRSAVLYMNPWVFSLKYFKFTEPGLLLQNVTSAALLFLTFGRLMAGLFVFVI